ncbi:MAG: hypothetical protein VB050_01320 [Geobacteraceae bacterium]|nr:hypothetical protein [Geobacteraceae bacterium]
MECKPGAPGFLFSRERALVEFRSRRMSAGVEHAVEDYGPAPAKAGLASGPFVRGRWFGVILGGSHEKKWFLPLKKTGIWTNSHIRTWLPYILAAWRMLLDK